MARVIRFIIAGAAGSFVGWLIVEPVNWLTPSGAVILSYPALVTLGAVIGLTLGLALGLAELLSGMSMRDAGRAIGAGALIGAVGGMLGISFGQGFYGPMSRLANAAGTAPFIGFMLELIGRTVGWALIGSFIGATQGIAFSAPKRMINGAAGGFIGGAVGGAAFAILNIMNASGAVMFSGGMLRLIGLLAIGAGVGFFIGLFEELFKQAWVVVLRGRNEGREFILFKDITVLGRNELADVPVFSDTSVAPMHAEIRLANNRHTLLDMGSPFGTMVNGMKIRTHELRDGDIIELGSVKIEFREKATASRIPRHVDKQPARQPQIPTSQHVCPFCGSVKDTSGKCECSVGGPQAAASAPAPQASPTVQTSAAGQAVLVGVFGAYAGRTFSLGKGETLIGREAGKTISLSSDSTVSRSHAKITFEGGQFVIYDEGSSNGTLVNESKVVRQPLKSGDVIQIGSTQFRFEG